MTKRLNQRYLLIGGAPKSGTTSLFRYLSDHPAICPANRKETYFFAREFDYNNICTEEQTAAAFAGYFSHCQANHRWRLEATPYTMYGDGAAEKIATLLPNTTMLFVLRDPVERLISNYFMQRQRQVPHVARKPLELYLAEQFEMRDRVPNNLLIGRYSKYLTPFLETLGREKVIILFFEELIAAPGDVLGSLTRRLDVDSRFFANYQFDIFNKSVGSSRPWLNKAIVGMEPRVAAIRARLIAYPRIHQIFERSVRAGRKGLYAVNKQQPRKQNPLSTELRQKLIDFYQPYNENLAHIIHRSLPWKSVSTTL